MASEWHGTTCDYCREECDATLNPLVKVDCSMENKTCPSENSFYHQACLDKHLKHRNTRMGFNCPRGCSRKSAFSAPCTGRIDRSHPIIHKKMAKPQPVVDTKAPPPWQAKATAPAPAVKAWEKPAPVTVAKAKSPWEKQAPAWTPPAAVSPWAFPSSRTWGPHAMVHAIMARASEEEPELDFDALLRTLMKT